MKIVNQFRALHYIPSIVNMYWIAGQKYAAKMLEDCAKISDDEILLDRLRDHVFAFVDSMQALNPD